MKTAAFLTVLAVILSALATSDAAFGAEPPEVQWERTYGGEGGDQATSVLQTSHGGYILTVCAESPGDGASVCLFRTDNEGSELWAPTLGMAENTCAASLEETRDGGFRLAVCAEDQLTLIKIDASGNEEWSQSLDGAHPDCSESVEQTEDGGFVVIACAEGVVRLVKLSAEGEELWARALDDAQADCSVNFVKETLGGDLLVTICSSGDVVLLRLDPGGDFLWERVFGGLDEGCTHLVLETTDGAILLAGSTAAFGAGEESYSYGWSSLLSRRLR